MTQAPVQEWAEQRFTAKDALEWLQARARQRCDRNVGWNFVDVSAVRVLAERARELGFLEEDKS